jgi:polyhydroxyalkanoate synthesis regulator phasin
MSIVQEFKEQFEEVYKDILNEYGNIPCEKEDIAECFKSIFFENDYSVSELIEDSIKDWIENAHSDLLDRQDRLDSIEQSIAELEQELADLKDEKAELEQLESNETWDNVQDKTPQSNSWNDNSNSW